MKAGELPRGYSSATRGRTGVWLNNVRAALLSVVFPAGCRICEQLLTEATRIPICNDCLGSFRLIVGTVCGKCGGPVEASAIPGVEMFMCPRCVNEDWGGYAFDR